MLSSIKLNKSPSKVILILSILILIVSSADFNFDTGNGGFQIIIQTVVPKIYQDVSPGGSDATLLFRLTMLVTVAWFDAIAPYHPTAIGIYTKHAHRLTETTNKNKNIALIYAGYHVLLGLYPNRKADWDAMMVQVGLDPALNSSDANTPEGLGIIAGKNTIANRLDDGMNQLGDRMFKFSKKYHRQPYSDYTGYKPKNTAYQLSDPNSWQPAVVTQGNGIFRVQQFVTPQMGQTVPFSYKNSSAFRVDRPYKSDFKRWIDYLTQAQILVGASANLDEQKKLKSEFFDNKFNSLGASVHAALRNKRIASLHEFVHLQILTQMAAFDTAIVVWQEKKKYDAIRPWSAIGFIWGDRHLTAWGGPGKGLVNDLPANQWRSYLKLADHPEYPSGSASFCAAHTTAARRYFNNDDTLQWTIPILKGQSTIEPGFSPASDTTISFATWTQFNNDCGSSRVWGGVHFPDAVEAGRKIGAQIAQCAYQFVKAHIDGRFQPSNSKCKYQQ